MLLPCLVCFHIVISLDGQPCLEFPSSIIEAHFIYVCIYLFFLPGQTENCLIFLVSGERSVRELEVFYFLLFLMLFLDCYPAFQTLNFLCDFVGLYFSNFMRFRSYLLPCLLQKRFKVSYHTQSIFQRKKDVFHEIISISFLHCCNNLSYTN